MFDKLCAFSEFGFPKSHAYAFAVLAYQSAWLRHYYGAEYYAALLNNQPMGFYAPHVLIGDARRHGLQVLRVAINQQRPARCRAGSMPGAHSCSASRRCAALATTWPRRSSPNARRTGRIGRCPTCCAAPACRARPPST